MGYGKLKRVPQMELYRQYRKSLEITNAGQYRRYNNSAHLTWRSGIITAQTFIASALNVEQTFMLRNLKVYKGLAGRHAVDLGSH